MQWIEVTVNTSPEKIDLLCAKLETLDISGLIIEDEQDIRNFLRENKKYWDYIDEELEESIKGLSRVKFYLEDSPEGEKQLEEIKSALAGENITSRSVRDEDWENNWKQYYKPIKIGKKLLIVPLWESAENDDGRTILKLDPGLIFGTGSHPTTQMCLEELEDMAGPGKTILDLGCGSGILAIAGILLGTDRAIGCDIDEKAPDIAMENAQLNGITEENIKFIAGDVVGDKNTDNIIGHEKYDIITANIVADVIIALAPKIYDYLADDGTFVCSGIIDGRQSEVKQALEAHGLEVEKECRKDDWYAFCGCKKKN